MAAALPVLPASVRTRGYEGPRDVVLPHHSMLPKQPGHNWADTAFKQSHCKKQALSSEGTGNFGRTYKPTFVRNAAQAQDFQPNSQLLARCLADTARPAADHVPAVPQTAAETVLRFWGYWREAPVESGVEMSRVRRVVCLFYPQDETMMIIEPRVANSGIQGGTLMKRHRVPAPRRRARGDDDDDRHLNVEDLNVGQEFAAYGKRIRLVSCDDRTREFLTTAVGVAVPAEEGYPADEYFEEHRANRVDPKKKPRSYDDFDLRMTFEQSSKGRVVKHYPDEIQRTQKFLRDSGKVCRFWAYWDDSGNAHGDLRRYEIRYFCEDDTVEVIERLHGNSGREPGRAFRRRCRLPRGTDQARKGLELTFASRVNGVQGNAPTDSNEEKYVGLQHLGIGKEIEVYSRALRIYSVDRWTREYYAKHLGQELPEDEPMPSTEKPSPPALPPPKHDGYGTEEDSLGNCASLMCKAPKVDLRKWQRHANDLLRFKMKMHNPSDANDVMRRFVLTFFMADDTVLINEMSIRNAGFLAGRFLKRQKVKKYSGEGARTWYGHDDFFPGAVVTIFSHVFEILEQDQRTDVLKDPSLAVAAEVTQERVAEVSERIRRSLLAKHSTLTEAFRHYDADKDGQISLTELTTMMVALHMEHVTEAEALAVMQQWNTDADGKLSLNEFVHGMEGDVPAAPLGRDPAPYHAKAAAKPLEHERRRVLRTFKEKLESRQLSVFEMYRMLSTMPAEYSSNPKGEKDAACLTSGGADSLLGPVQLRRGIEERFNLRLTPMQLNDLISFFFPTLPRELMMGTRSQTGPYRLALAEFQQRWNEMEKIGQLPPSDGLDQHALSSF